jgi:hypothetical protein
MALVATSGFTMTLQRSIFWQEGQSLWGATHVIYEGAVEPLHFDVPPVQGVWPSHGKPFINVGPKGSTEGLVFAQRVDITPAMLRTMTVLRLPADEKEVAALLASGAVPGVKVACVEHDDKDESYDAEGRTFPAVLDGTRKHVVHDGSLRPVYQLSRYHVRHFEKPGFLVYDRVKERIILDAPGLAIYLEIEAPA